MYNVITNNILKYSNIPPTIQFTFDEEDNRLTVNRTMVWFLCFI